MTREILEIYEGRIRSDRKALFVDATLGSGGHALAVLEKFPHSRVTAFDQDEQARAIASRRLFGFADRVRIIPENFRKLSVLAEEAEWPGADGILFDLGVSNMQLVTPERGFSYQEDGPLDMRMDTGGDSPTAEDVLAESDARELSRIFREYGEERHAYRIAKAIVSARERGESLKTTGDLTALIRKTLPAPVQRKMGTHPSRRVFQALRIAVNSELETLDEGLEGAITAAGDFGVIIVISYHSLEDRIVKRRFLRWSSEGLGRILAKRPIVPGDDEIESNRSSRSAKLRVFIKGETQIRGKRYKEVWQNESARGKT
jgi:16S rRNA (cytosine1402-N4)-methyltransferase